MHFTLAGYNDVQLSRFGINLLDLDEEAPNMQLMLIVKTGDDIKAKIAKLLNLWVTTRKDPNWENLIAALQYIGLDNLAKALTDELNEGPSIQGNFNSCQ